MLVTIVFLTFCVSILSLLGGFLLLIKKTRKEGLSLQFTSFAAGALLSTAFLDLLPEGIEHALEQKLDTYSGIFLPMFIGIIFFFLLERTFLWFHHHHGEHNIHPTVWMVTFGDGLHNFIDGVAIASSYMINPALGYSTAIAVAVHEVPQELADFSILLARGLSKARAVLFNIASAMTAIVGAILTFYFASLLSQYLHILISFTAGMFAYIALSDLIPELHHAESKIGVLPHLLTFFLGIILIVFTSMIFE